MNYEPTIRPLEQINAWFRKGLYPKSVHFWDTFFSFWHKNDKIPMDSIGNLTDTLNNKYDRSDADVLEGKMAGIDDRLSGYDNFIDTLFKDVDEHEVRLNGYDARIEALAQENEELRTDLAELTSKLESLAALVGTANAALEQRLKGL